jgi:hypothetical protein
MTGKLAPVKGLDVEGSDLPVPPATDKPQFPEVVTAYTLILNPSVPLALYAGD